MTKRKVVLKKKQFKRFFVLLPACIALLTFMIVYLGNYWVNIVSKYQENEILKERLVLLKEKELELTVDAEKLQDPEYIARYAREKYLFSKDGEIIIKLPDQN